MPRVFRTFRLKCQEAAAAAVAMKKTKKKRLCRPTQIELIAFECVNQFNSKSIWMLRLIGEGSAASSAGGPTLLLMGSFSSSARHTRLLIKGNIDRFVMQIALTLVSIHTHTHRDTQTLKQLSSYISSDAVFAHSNTEQILTYKNEKCVSNGTTGLPISGQF